MSAFGDLPECVKNFLSKSINHQNPFVCNENSEDDWKECENGSKITHYYYIILLLLSGAS